jgi:group II intron reverse transcriptase/maturase
LGNGDGLMELIVARGNVKAALRRVKENRGSAGVDGMTVGELGGYLTCHWEAIRAQLLSASGSYQPQPVRRQAIPKPGGGERELGIPTVLDRFIQQSILQVLQPLFDPTFCEHSYGFRPGRRAHDAVRQAQCYVQEGYSWVVDVDLERFFDRVNHDVLMGRLAKRVADRRLLGLIRRYLEAGVMAGGVIVERHEGTPQGGPLSPLLANVLLDEVDQELQRRGHRFVRYADDCNVYVRSKRAGERVMQSLRGLYGQLRLRVNDSKSAVARPWERSFLGFSFWVSRGGTIRRRIAPKALTTMKQRVREITRRTRGRALSAIVTELAAYLRGWKNYFHHTEMQGQLRDLDGWIRRRLRLVQLKQWKQGTTAFRELRTRGVPVIAAAQAANHLRRWWQTSKYLALSMALSKDYFNRLGLTRLAA